MRLGALAAGLFGILVGAANAQTWPQRPIHIVVPFAAGGAVDVTGRLFAQAMQESLNTPVIIDNRPGAGGNVGTEFVARAAPDGYTILLTTNGQSISPAVFKALSWDPFRDFIPVTELYATSIVYAVNPASPLKGLQDMIAAAKARPGEMNYAGTGVGNAFHLTMELLKLRAGFDMQMVTYKSDGEIINALLGNQVQVGLLPISTARAQVLGGALRALANTAPTRSKFLPDAPTIAEQGVPDFSAQGYEAFFAPAGTPPAIVARIYQAARAALDLPLVRERLADFAVEPLGSSPDEFAAFYRDDVARFRQVVRDARIPLQD